MSQISPQYGQYLGSLLGNCGLGVAVNAADMVNQFRSPPLPRYPRTDPKRPMSDKAAHLLSLGGCIRSAA